MYKISESSGKKMQKEAALGPPFGPGFITRDIEQADLMETWAAASTIPAPTSANTDL